REEPFRVPRGLRPPVPTQYSVRSTQKTDEYEYLATEHLRLSGVYWGLVALDLLGHLDALKREDVIAYVASCQAENGSVFSCALLPPFYLPQSSLYLDTAPLPRIAPPRPFWGTRNYVASGGFCGHVRHDPHLLYTLSAVQILVLHDALDAVDVEKIVQCKPDD
ncbi:MAG: hypothetical protein BJ554DRAFT_7248, partial [Olpidium bornovanus]